MRTDGDGPRRRGASLLGLTVLGLLVGASAAAVWIFEIGILTGLAMAGAGYVAYAVPAHLLGWPVPTLHDAAALLVGLVQAIVAGVVALLFSVFD